MNLVWSKKDDYFCTIKGEASKAQKRARKSIWLKGSFRGQSLRLNGVFCTVLNLQLMQGVGVDVQRLLSLIVERIESGCWADNHHCRQNAGCYYIGD